jgi:hypothetical protein
MKTFVLKGFYYRKNEGGVGITDMHNLRKTKLNH